DLAMDSTRSFSIIPSNRCRFSCHAGVRRSGALPAVRGGETPTLLACLAQEGAHGVRGLGAPVHPLLHLFLINRDLRRVNHGIVVPKEIERAAVAPVLAVHGHDAVERTLLGTHAGQSELDSHESYPRTVG